MKKSQKKRFRRWGEEYGFGIARSAMLEVIGKNPIGKKIDLQFRKMRSAMRREGMEDEHIAIIERAAREAIADEIDRIMTSISLGGLDVKITDR